MKRAHHTMLSSRSSFESILSRVTALALIVGCSSTVFVQTGCSSSGSQTASVDTGVSSILFIKRQTTTVDASGNVTIDVAGGNGQVLDYDRYVPGGSLNILAPARPDGTLTNLTGTAFPQADFNGADVSYDATQAVFSMKTDPNDSYHIYTVQLTPDAAGVYEIHQKTSGSQDDMNPVYMPGGVIVFITNQMYTQMGTRADEYEHSRAATQLASISVDGGDADRYLFAQSLSHTVAPFARHDGKVGYSRWEHLGPVNDVKIFAANPDGTQMLAVGGQHGKPSNSLFSVRETQTPNVMIGIGTERSRTIHAGALVQIDSRNQADPVCLDANADQSGHACIDEENSVITVLSTNVPTSADPSPVGRYREPSVLPDGRILTSWADGPVNDLSEASETPPDFGIYIFDPTTQQNQLVYNDRSTWDLNALAITVRATPPEVPNLQNSQDATQPVRIGSVSLYAQGNTSLQESITGAEFANVPLSQALQGAVSVRVIEGFSSEAAKGISMFGLTMHEGAAVLGEAPVYGDGSWLANIPAFIPVHLQPIDKFGLAIRSQGLWMQGMPGEDRRCVGCHESRTGQGVPAFGSNPTMAEVKTAQTFTEAIADRTEYPWDRNDLGKPFVQQVLTAKCAQCHNETTNGNGPQTFYDISRTDPATGTTTTYHIPTLDLSDRPITVYYDESVRTYPASYVSIFYPATIMVGSMGIKLTAGTIPPNWGVPGSARASKLIETINAQAADGSYAWALDSTHVMHPEDQASAGAMALTADERQMLIRVMDLGGQFYARQNTGFTAVAASDDPVSGSK